MGFFPVTQTGKHSLLILSLFFWLNLFLVLFIFSSLFFDLFYIFINHLVEELNTVRRGLMHIATDWVNRSDTIGDTIDCGDWPDSRYFIIIIIIIIIITLLNISPPATISGDNLRTSHHVSKIAQDSKTLRERQRRNDGSSSGWHLRVVDLSNVIDDTCFQIFHCVASWKPQRAVLMFLFLISSWNDVLEQNAMAV